MFQLYFTNFISSVSGQLNQTQHRSYRQIFCDEPFTTDILAQALHYSKFRNRFDSRDQPILKNDTERSEAGIIGYDFSQVKRFRVPADYRKHTNTNPTQTSSKRDSTLIGIPFFLTYLRCGSQIGTQWSAASSHNSPLELCSSLHSKLLCCTINIY